MVKKFLALSMLDSRAFFQLSPHYRSHHAALSPVGLGYLTGIMQDFADAKPNSAELPLAGSHNMIKLNLDPDFFTALEIFAQLPISFA